MDNINHPNKNKAVEIFLNNFEKLTHLPLISDAEMAMLYGTQVQNIINEIQAYNGQEKICHNCVSRCCNMVKCEFYSSELSQCVLHQSRPVLCRVHFCHKFAEKYGIVVKEIGDIFLDGLQILENSHNPKVKFFDTPPLGNYLPEILAKFKAKLVEFKAGIITESELLETIQIEVGNLGISFKAESS